MTGPADPPLINIDRERNCRVFGALIAGPMSGADHGRGRPFSAARSVRKLRFCPLRSTLFRAGDRRRALLAAVCLSMPRFPGVREPGSPSRLPGEKKSPANGGPNMPGGYGPCGGLRVIRLAAELFMTIPQFPLRGRAAEAGLIESTSFDPIRIRCLRCAAPPRKAYKSTKTTAAALFIPAHLIAPRRTRSAEIEHFGAHAGTGVQGRAPGESRMCRFEMPRRRPIIRALAGLAPTRQRLR